VKWGRLKDRRLVFVLISERYSCTYLNTRYVPIQIYFTYLYIFREKSDKVKEKGTFAYTTNNLSFL